MKKKLIAIISMMVLTISLSACGGVANDTPAKEHSDKMPNKLEATKEVEDTGHSKRDDVVDDFVEDVSQSDRETNKINGGDKIVDGDLGTSKDTGEPKDKSDTVTAAILVDSLKDFEYDYVDANMTLFMSMNGTSTAMDMHVVTDKKWAMVDTTFGGYSFETWLDYSTGDGYTSVAGGEWQKSEGSTSVSNVDFGVDSSVCERLNMEVKDDYYEVTGYIPADVAATLMDTDEASLDDDDMDAFSYYITYRFDKETKEIIYARIDIRITNKYQRENGIDSYEYYIECFYNEINSGKTLTPPDFN